MRTTKRVTKEEREAWREVATIGEHEHHGDVVHIDKGTLLALLDDADAAERAERERDEAQRVLVEERDAYAAWAVADRRGASPTEAAAFRARVAAATTRQLHADKLAADPEVRRRLDEKKGGLDDGEPSGL